MEQKDFIVQTVFDRLGFQFSGEIRSCPGEELTVDYDGEILEIGCGSRTEFARGLFEFVRTYNGNPVHFKEKAHFKTLGVQLDLSRNAVMTVEAVKNYLGGMACLGVNTLCLYMEDVFELREYPRFGYLRGRYTEEELREIDDYAWKLGIEVIPAIQTLGHMGQYLRWNESIPVRDTADILLADEPETYRLIEAIVSTMHRCFRTNRINIGMDESADLGRGKHLDRFGWEKGTDIFLRHLEQVCKICEKYGMKPMMYDDMFFRLGSKTGDYYDRQAEITEDTVSKIPDVQMCYWDYYSEDREKYEHFLEKRKDFNRDIVFLGSFWTYEGFAEDTEYTIRTSIPAMEACLRQGVQEVLITTWGDGGGETNLMQTLGTLPIFSEYCYRGEECSIEDIAEASECLTQMPWTNRMALARAHSSLHSYSKVCRRMVYGDLFYNLIDLRYDEAKVLEDFEFCRDSAARFMEKRDKNYAVYQYYYLLTKIAAAKCRILGRLQNAYREKDRAYLRELAEQKLPALLEDYREFLKVFRAQWLETNKPNGLEVINIRLGGVMCQTEYVQERLLAYLSGRITSIPELEYELVRSENPVPGEFWEVCTPSIIH